MQRYNVTVTLVICSCSCFIKLPNNIAAATSISDENLRKIQALLADNEGAFESPSIGPVRLVLQDIQVKCLQDLVPACALDTILVSNISDMENVKKLLTSKSLPVPDIVVTDLSPDAQLYDGIPPQKALGEQLLQSLPASIANYLIDHYEIELHRDMIRNRP